jgi:hypothetical protein
MKMIHTSCGLMTPLEAKMIGDINREEKRNKTNSKTKPIKK